MTNETPGSDQSVWDAGYSSGRWDYLHGSEEHGRYALVAAHVRRHLGACKAGSVLDVGCGEAILYDYLEGLPPGRYLGCDISEIAVAAALRRHPGLRIDVAPVESFRPPGSMDFSAIVFNEVLYYLEKPGAVVDTLAQRLAPGGAVIVSMYCPPTRLRPWHETVASVWQELEHLAWPELDRLRLTSLKARRTWEVRVWTRPAPDAAPTN